MQRPVMNPNFFEDATSASSPVSRRRRLLRLAGAALWRTLKVSGRVLLYDPLHGFRGFRVEEGTPTSRFVRGLMYRLAFAPFLIALVASVIVWVATHPRPAGAELDPASQGIYYQPVTFLGSDQTRLEGWLASVLDAKLVLSQQDKILREKHPAIILVHDFGQRREQMLPYIKPLHEDGFVVLTFNLRGGGPAAVQGQTFGLREANDVRAAAEMLRRRPFVDPSRVAVIGVGTGATAALLAANGDPLIHAIVAVHPMWNSRELMQTRLMPNSSLLNWLAPLCKWTFEIAYGVDAEELEMKNFRKLRASRPVLVVNPPASSLDPCDPRMMTQVRAFLASPKVSISKAE